MASGLASTTRFIGILVSVAALGAVLSNVARERFVAAATQVGFTVDAAVAAAARVTSGDLSGVLASAQPGARDALRSAALAAYGAGFGSAALVSLDHQSAHHPQAIITGYLTEGGLVSGRAGDTSAVVRRTPVHRTWSPGDARTGPRTSWSTSPGEH